MASAPEDEPPLRSLIQPVEVRLSIPQQELRVQFETSGLSHLAQLSACFSLLACIAGASAGHYVDALEIKAGDSRAVPLKDAIADVPFATLFRDQYAAGLTTNDVRHEIILSTAVATDDLGAFRESAAGSVMFTTVDYYLTSDFSKIVLRLHAAAFARSEGARDKLGQAQDLGDDPRRGNVLSKLNSFYWRDVRYEAALPSPDKSAERNVEAWKRDGASRVRTAILAGVEQITRASARDFGTRLWSSGAKLPQVKTRDDEDAGLVEEVPQQGRLLRLSDGVLLFEATVPEIGSVPAPVSAASP
jgi:hypothetical protein